MTADSIDVNKTKGITLRIERSLLSHYVELSSEVNKKHLAKGGRGDVTVQELILHRLQDQVLVRITSLAENDDDKTAITLRVPIHLLRRYDAIALALTQSRIDHGSRKRVTAQQIMLHHLRSLPSWCQRGDSESSKD